MPGSPSSTATRPRPARTIWNASRQSLQLRMQRPTMRARQADLLEAARTGPLGAQADDAIQVEWLGLALDLNFAAILEFERAAR